MWLSNRPWLREHSIEPSVWSLAPLLRHPPPLCLSPRWYYNTETKTQTWIKPEEFIKKDAVSAAATAKNEARGV